MTKRVITSMALAASLVLALPVPPVLSEGKQEAGRVAVVNGTAIPRAEFDREMARIKQQFLSRGEKLSGSRLSEIEGEVLETLINRELLYQESRKKGITIDEARIDEELGRLKKRFGSEEKFKSALKETKITEAELRSHFRQGMAIQQFIDEEFARKVKVTEKEARKYYDENREIFKQPEQVRASHILIKVDPGADESKKKEARKRLEALQKKLKEGEDFAKLAREFSEGPSSSRGGDLGYFGRGQMVKPFEDAAFALKPGEVSGIVETRFGYHLIKVIDRRPETVIAFEEIKERLGEFLKQEKVKKDVALYVEKLKEKAKIERLLPGR